MAVKFHVNGMRYTTGLLELRGKRFQSVEQYTAYLDAAKTHWEESVRSEEPEMMAKLIPKVCLTVGDDACLPKLKALYEGNTFSSECNWQLILILTKQLLRSFEMAVEKSFYQGGS